MELDGTKQNQDGGNNSQDLNNSDNKNQSSDDGKGNSETPKTYTQEEFDKAIKEARLKDYSDHMAKAGVKYKPIADENATLKTQLKEINDTKAGLETIIETLKTRIEELSANDPDKQKWLKKLKEAEDKEKNLSNREKELNSREAEQTKKIASSTAKRLAKEFEVDETKLFEMSQGNPDIMEDLAPLLPKKEKGKEPEKKGITVTSIDGTSPGNSTDFSKMSPEDKISYGLKHPKK